MLVLHKEGVGFLDKEGYYTKDFNKACILPNLSNLFNHFGYILLENGDLKEGFKVLRCRILLGGEYSEREIMEEVLAHNERRGRILADMLNNNL